MLGVYQRRGERMRREASSLVLEGKRVEVSLPVVIVLVLSALEEADDGVGHGRHYNLHHGLEAPVEEHAADKVLGRPESVEGDGVEDEAVETLADDGRADGAGPEPPAARENLHFGQDVGVGEVTGPEGDHR